MIEEREKMRIEILGAPFNALGSPPDQENPSEGLRRAGLIGLLESRGHTVKDNGDLLDYRFMDKKDSRTGIKDFGIWIDVSNALSRELGKMLSEKSFPILLGGDCAMLVGIFSAFAQRDEEIGLVFLDGHADFHTAETSRTGDPADMELAVLTGRGHEEITRIAGKYPLVKEENVVVFGIRAHDGIEQSNIRFFDSRRMTTMGMKAALEVGLKKLLEKSIPLWLHLDVDVLDPELMPAMYPEKDGFTFEELYQLLDFVMATKKVLGLSIACYHPFLDKDSKAAKRLVEIVSEAI